MTQHAELPIERLRADFAGPVIAPDDADYDSARKVPRPGTSTAGPRSSSGPPATTTSRRRGSSFSPANWASTSRSARAATAAKGDSTTGMAASSSTWRDLKGPRHRPRREGTAWAETGLHRGRRDVAAGTARPGHRVRRHRVGRHRRNYDRRRCGLPRAQARPDDRQRPRRRRRHGRRAAPSRGQGHQPGPVLGDPRRRWQLRRRHAVPVPAGRGRPAWDRPWRESSSCRSTSEIIERYIKLWPRDAPDELSSIANVMPVPPLPGVPEDEDGSASSGSSR